MFDDFIGWCLFAVTLGSLGCAGYSLCKRLR
jgi:hypothetical protein